MENCRLRPGSSMDDVQIASLNKAAEGKTSDVRAEEVPRELIDDRLRSRAHDLGIQALPLVADRSMRLELHIVPRSEPLVSAYTADIAFDDPEQLYGEDPLGCARGVVFAFAFQVALVIAVAVLWRLRLFLR